MNNFSEIDTLISYMQTRWESGEQRVDRQFGDGERREVIEYVIEGILSELERRIGQSFSTLELANQLDSAEQWALDVAHTRAPNQPWAWDMDTVLDAACYRYARRANDYQSYPADE